MEYNSADGIRRVAITGPQPAQGGRRPRPGVPVLAEGAGPRGSASGSQLTDILGTNGRRMLEGPRQRHAPEHILVGLTPHGFTAPLDSDALWCLARLLDDLDTATERLEELDMRAKSLLKESVGSHDPRYRQSKVPEMAEIRPSEGATAHVGAVSTSRGDPRHRC